MTRCACYGQRSSERRVNRSRLPPAPRSSASTGYATLGATASAEIRSWRSLRAQRDASIEFAQSELVAAISSCAKGARSPRSMVGTHGSGSESHTYTGRDSYLGRHFVARRTLCQEAGIVAEPEVRCSTPAPRPDAGCVCMLIPHWQAQIFHLCVLA